MAQLRIEPLPRNATPGEVLRFVAGRGRIDGSKIGKIVFLGRGARVEVPDNAASGLVTNLDGAPFRDRPVRVDLPSGVGGATTGHFGHLAGLLKLEAEAERAQLAERAKTDAPAGEGTTLLGLIIVEEDAGLGGRLLLSFARKSRQEPLPPCRLGPGAPVVVTESGSRRPTSLRGVVSERGERTITVAFDHDGDVPPDAIWRIDLSPDEASRQRQMAAMHRVAASAGDRLAELREILLGERAASFDPTAIPPGELPDLNESQRDAVRHALAARDVALIHGPPGTGKTTAVVALIREAIRRGDKILACAPSNAAVDLLVDRLLAAGEEPVRLGHPARVSPLLRDRALDLLVQSHPDARQARKFTREAHALFRKADKWTKTPPPPGERQSLRAEAKQLLADARTMEQLAVERILDEASVICATLTGVDSETLGQRRFDLVVIDEACQSTEPACWVPLVRAERVILAGDPCQLPPTVLSADAAEEGLAVSLMERLTALDGSTLGRMLQTQYRMHGQIMDFPSAEFYRGELIADPGVIDHRLDQLPGVQPGPGLDEPVRFIDTAGASFDEALEEDTGSRRNPQEAGLLARYARRFLEAGVAPGQIAVITPYAAQVRLLRDLLAGTGIEIDSVDGFQGREKEVVLVSLVRSNPEGEIGFLGDVRRTNVAMTRARRSLVVIGDSATLAVHPFYQRLIEYAEKIGAYHSVWEETE